MLITKEAFSHLLIVKKLLSHTHTREAHRGRQIKGAVESNVASSCRSFSENEFLG